MAQLRQAALRESANSKRVYARIMQRAFLVHEVDVDAVVGRDDLEGPLVFAQPKDEWRLGIPDSRDNFFHSLAISQRPGDGTNRLCAAAHSSSAIHCHDGAQSLEAC